MTIHTSHPFAPPPEDQDLVRRLRGHLPAPVSIWTSSEGQRRDGWTISSLLVGHGEPAELVALVDEACDWWELFRETGEATVNILGPNQGAVADAFARIAPSPGGPFRTGSWLEAESGPRLQGAAAWVRVHLINDEPEHAGWGLLVRARVEEIDLSAHVPALEHRGGRYLS